MSTKNFVGWTVARLLGIFILIGLVAGGSFMAYRAGVAHGVAQSPEVAAAIESAAENGQGVPPIYGHGYPHGYKFGFGHTNFFFPFGMLCFSIFFFLLFVGVIKMVFFRRMMRYSWGRHGHGRWGKDWESGVPPMFHEWHKRAHGESADENKEKAE